MSNIDNITSTLPSSCDVNIPDSSANIQEVISRWSDAVVSHPAAIVKPSSERDIIATLKYATENRLQIIPANGGHGSFVPINRGTIYMDMSKFKSVQLDKEHGLVEISGGCVTGEVIKALTPEGWYTLTPNSDSVGMIGAFLGGLSHILNGYHGSAIDHIREITVIPFSSPEDSMEPRSLVLTPNSTGEEKALFNVLCGGGHGLGVVTSIKLTAWPISDLNLSDNKIWSRRLLYPASQVEAAAELYTSLRPLPKMTAMLAFFRAPPTAPVPGAAMIMLGVSHFGPAADAEKAAAKTFEERYVSKAATAVTAPTRWEDMNAAAASSNAHGGYKEYHGCFLQEVSPSDIKSSFDLWNAFTEKQEVKRSYMVLASWDTACLQAYTGPKDETFRFGKDRGWFCQVVPWYYDTSLKAEADTFGRGVVTALRAKDRSAGRKDLCFANNMIAGQDFKEVYSDNQIKEIKRVKAVWDVNSLGWNPVVDAW